MAKLPYIYVYTDGSHSYDQDNGKSFSGHGVWFGSKHPDNVCGSGRATSALKAELMAIKAALDIIVNRQDARRYKICIDSREAYWSALSGTYMFPSDAKLVASISWLIDKKHCGQGTIFFELIRGHSGIYGNECADTLAHKGRLRAIHNQKYGCYETPPSSDSEF